MRLPRWYLLPHAVAGDLQHIRENLRTMSVRVSNIDTTLRGMRRAMAADREMLAGLAEDMATLATPVQDLLDKYAAANARIAELEGQAAADEVADLEAIRPVRDAFDAIARKFREEPEAPDVEPLPGDVPSENLPDSTAPVDDTDGDEPARS